MLIAEGKTGEGNLFSCPRFSDSVEVGNQSDIAKDFSCDSVDWERGKLVRM